MKTNRFKVVSILDRQPAQKTSTATDMKALLRNLEGLSTPKLVVKNSEVAKPIGMTSEDLATQARKLSPVGLLMLIEALSEELRRLNALAADRDGVTPNEASSLTAGEAAVEGLGKTAEKASQRDALHTQAQVEDWLETAIEAHHWAQTQNPGGIRSSRPGNAMTLDEVERYAESQARIAEQLRHHPDEDAGAAALGLSPASQDQGSRVAKSSAPLRADSYAGQTDVADSMAKAERQRDEIAPPWYLRDRAR